MFTRRGEGLNCVWALNCFSLWKKSEKMFPSCRRCVIKTFFKKKEKLASKKVLAFPLLTFVLFFHTERIHCKVFLTSSIHSALSLTRINGIKGCLFCCCTTNFVLTKEKGFFFCFKNPTAFHCCSTKSSEDICFISTFKSRVLKCTNNTGRGVV